MRLVRGFGGLPPGLGATVAAMGNFDGVHRGHQAILARVSDRARARGLQSCALTFHPHPLRILAPERAPAMIQTLEDRLEALAGTGVDLVVLVPFTLQLADVTAEAFIEEYLLGRLHCAELHVGADARFGRGRRGDVAMLQAYAASGKLDVTVAGEVRIDGERVSSSGIRRLIVEGHVDHAARLVGRPFSIAGEVVTGAGRGRGLGFPTANVLPDGETRPADGVYAALGETADGRRWPAAVHLGPIPTFRVVRPVMEAHLVGYEGDLVGTRLRLHFLSRIRDVVHFDDLESLKRKIDEDVGETVRIVREHEL
jgi:riboflavin kinase/FMN adenylyltransferase